MKDIIILGGSNGAGKTTAAQVLIPREFSIQEFVNADEIARGLSPFNVDSVALKAGRLMLERIDDIVRAGERQLRIRDNVRWKKSCEMARSV